MHMFAKKFWGGVPAKEEEDDGGQAGRSGNLLSGEKKLNKATRDVLGNKLRGMKASKDTEKEMSTRNFSPAFLKMAERNFYLFATKTKQGKQNGSQSMLFVWKLFLSTDCLKSTAKLMVHFQSPVSLFISWYFSSFPFIGLTLYGFGPGQESICSTQENYRDYFTF